MKGLQVGFREDILVRLGSITLDIEDSVYRGDKYRLFVGAMQVCWGVSRELLHLAWRKKHNAT